ncbi:MAG: response regulator [Fibrobacteres bacterium]|nr:response regulator [Fibrobacterota bacterium]
MKTILIIEDDHDAADMLRLFLSKKGFKTAVAENGIEGLSMVKFLKPDVIIVDLMIPGMDGKNLIDELRDNIYTQNKLIIVASGLIKEDGKPNTSLGLSVEMAFSKPINLAKLHDTITAHFAQ